MMRYIITIPAVTIVIMTVFLLIAVHFLSNAAIAYEVMRELRKSIEGNVRNAFVVDGMLQLENDFMYETDSIRFLILKRDGTICSGTYPEGTRETLSGYSIRPGVSYGIVCGGRKYYVRDRRIGDVKDRGDFYLRGIIDEADTDSFYRRLEMMSYFVLAGILAASLLGESMLFFKIRKELKTMCQAAEGIGTSRDISQRMKEDHRMYELGVLAQANNRMLDRLAHTLSMQEQFTSDVAHELRTPATVILAQCEQMMKRTGAQGETDEGIEVIYRQSKRMETLIHWLLNLSRLDQDRMQLKAETLDLVEIAQSVGESFLDKTDFGARICFHLKEACSTGDIHLIAIAIENLLSNAVKFSGPDGTVTVSTGMEDGFAYVRVEDDGIGIRPEEMEKIFSRFYRCDKSRNTQGFGLGLSLAEKIVEKHGGRIAAASEYGAGSVFTIYLPGKS